MTMSPSRPSERGPRRRLRPHRRAEVAVFDIVLYVPLLLIALLFLQSTLTSPTLVVPENVNSSRYVYKAFTTSMASTVPSALEYNWEPEGFPGCPWPFFPNGCWYVGPSAPGTPVSDLILYDVYLVSCGITSQAQLNAPGWIGYSVNQTVLAVTEGTIPPAATPNPSPSTFSNYELLFNGTSLGGTIACPTSVGMIHVSDGFNPTSYGTPDVYTWDAVLYPPLGSDEGPVLVQIGVWAP